MAKAKESAKEVVTTPAGRAVSPFEQMERMFESFGPWGMMRPARWDWPSWGEPGTAIENRLPRVDVVDRDTEVVVRAEVPGVNKDDLDVSLNHNTVTIKGTVSREEKEEKGDYYRCEISRGSFARTVALPAEVDGNRARATFRDGVLELTLPKAEGSKRHSIAVE
ncbi:MAG TPA: Hsp20/alpha crystallin family protein [Gammaproteobacteria bacterium]|nr:Hsp20/alpha crystallin family protein [Gammaproteobacteria bacterium]